MWLCVLGCPTSTECIVQSPLWRTSPEGNTREQLTACIYNLVASEHTIINSTDQPFSLAHNWPAGTQFFQGGDLSPTSDILLLAWPQPALWMCHGVGYSIDWKCKRQHLVLRVYIPCSVLVSRGRAVRTSFRSIRGRNSLSIMASPFSCSRSVRLTNTYCREFKWRACWNRITRARWFNDFLRGQLFRNLKSLCKDIFTILSPFFLKFLNAFPQTTYQGCLPRENTGKRRKLFAQRAPHRFLQ